METTPQNQMGTIPDTMPDRGALANPMAPIEQPSSEGHDMKERATNMAQGAMDLGSRALHAVSSKIHEYPALPEGSRRKGRIIAIGSMTATGIGMMVRRRQQAKTTPQNIMGKAKELIHSH